MQNSKFCVNRSSGSGKEDFKGVCFTIYPYGGHLRHVTCIMFIHFHSFVPKSLRTQLLKMAREFLRKADLNFICK